MRSPDETRRRVKAARALAGISVETLADRIGQPGLGERTLRSLEGESGRPIRPMELQAIATATGLPLGFFTDDLVRVFESNGATTRLEEFEARLRRLEAERAAPAPPGELGRRAEGSQPSDERRRQDEHPEEGGQGQGAEG